MAYKLIKNQMTGEVDTVLYTDETNLQKCIPFKAGNRDYKEYLEWLEIDGNEPEAAD